MDTILESQIKFWEAMLDKVRFLSERSQVSSERVEETEDRILDKLSELYKQRKK